jgi:hypothetical protein
MAVDLRWVIACCGVAACLALPTAAGAQTVWSGLTYSFTKAPYADPDDPANQDAITQNVILTRASNGGLYNAVTETVYTFDVSPAQTLWATALTSPGETIAATNWANLTFTDWRAAYGGGNVLYPNVLDYNAVVYLTVDDVYLDLQITDWSAGMGGGGGFSYLRSEAIPEPATFVLSIAGTLALLPARRRGFRR